MVSSMVISVSVPDLTKIIGQLSALLPADRVLTDAEDLIPYSFDGTATLSISGNAGAAYHIVTSSNVALPLSQWTSVPGSAGNIGGGGTATVQISVSAPPQFYAVSYP